MIINFPKIRFFLNLLIGLQFNSIPNFQRTLKTSIYFIFVNLTFLTILHKSCDVNTYFLNHVSKPQFISKIQTFHLIVINFFKIPQLQLQKTVVLFIKILAYTAIMIPKICSNKIMSCLSTNAAICVKEILRMVVQQLLLPYQDIYMASVFCIRMDSENQQMTRQKVGLLLLE